jgi:hypothetical protein
VANGYLYVGTDQVRFFRKGQTQPMRLEEAPPLAFSELMRDVDLLVSVASVGNDPNWHDGGPGGRFRNYWNDYAFGELSVTGVTRREALAGIVPKLRIASRCELTDRFLVVRGDLRTYKIHLGSGNILMSPNDQYLRIVPRREQSDGPGNLCFLPFEGDERLSIILSKALLLAADRDIEDASIRSQIVGEESG